MAGTTPAQNQDLAGTWKLNGGSLTDGETAGYPTPGYDDSKWFTFQQPGSTYIDVTHRPGGGGGWNRFTFTPGDALLKSGKTIYLSICPFNDSRWVTPDTIYLNGPEGRQPQLRLRARVGPVRRHLDPEAGRQRARRPFAVRHDARSGFPHAEESGEIPDQRPDPQRPAGTTRASGSPRTSRGAMRATSPTCAARSRKSRSRSWPTTA